MKRWTCLVAPVMALMVVWGCGRGGPNPAAPNEQAMSGQSDRGLPSQASGALHVWGYYDIYIDVSTKNAVSVLDRSAMFQANVVAFLNKKPGSLQFNIYKIPVTPEFVDVDLDIGLTHPFAGMSEYNGYDVRGVFIGNGHGVLNHNINLKYAFKGMDQYMLDDPSEGDGGGPDGYTRWFNPLEFINPGVLGYTKGNASTPGYAGNATINPYKLFADGLGSHADALAFVKSSGGPGHNVFSAGSSNYRNYYLRFPTPVPAVKFNYAVLASWKGTAPSDHPANAPEVVAASVTAIDSSLFYSNDTLKGGNLVLNFSLGGYGAQPTNFYIESSLFKAVKLLKASNYTVGAGGATYSTYCVELQPENITRGGDYDVWLICQYPDLNYQNDYGVNNLAGTSPLEAYFRVNANVRDGEGPWIKVANPNGGEQWVPGAPAAIAWQWSNVSGNLKIEYSKDDFIKDVHPLLLNVPCNNSSVVIEAPYDPTKSAKVRIRSLDKAGVFDWSDNSFEIMQPTITVISPNGGEKYSPGSTMEIKWSSQNLVGNVNIEYSKDNFVSDFHPISMNEINDGSYSWNAVPFDTSTSVKVRVTSVKFGQVYDQSDGYFTIVQPTIHVTSPNGGEVWKSGSSHDITWTSTGLVGNVNIYFSRDNFVSDTNTLALNDPNDGSFTWINIPCDVSDTVVVRVTSSLFSQVSDKSDSNFSIISGNHVTTLGTANRDEGWFVSVDASGNYYITGICGVTSGNYDVALAKYDACGSQVWLKTWGGSDYDYGNCVAFDSAGNIYVTGAFNGTVDFDPGAGVTLKSSLGSYDIFLSKLDPSGNFMWVKTWGGTWTDGAYGLVVDSSNNVYVSGDFNYTVDFDPGGGIDNYASRGGWDAYLTKFDLNGNHIWTRTWGGPGNDYCYGLAISSGNELYCAGNFTGTVDFDTGSGVDNRTSNGLSDAYASKFDASGTRTWTRTWGGSGNDSSNRIIVDGNGKIDITGYFEGTVDLDPTGGVYNAVSNGASDAFYTRLDSSGGFSLARYWGGTGVDIGYGISCDSANGVYVCGSFQNTVDFDPGSSVNNHSSIGSDDVFTTKFDSSGNNVWARTIGTIYSDVSYGVATGESDSPYVAGFFRGNMDFAPTGAPCNEPSFVKVSVGSNDAFVVSYRSDGCW